MKSTIIFVVLQYIIGYAFAIGGMFLFSEKENFSLSTSIFYALLIGFACIITGVALVGYFHLRVKHVSHRFGAALSLSFAGLVLFTLLYIIIEKFLPQELNFLLLLLPLSGAVFGFNLVAVTAKKANL